MKVIEVRRHSVTRKGQSGGHGSALSQVGVDLARQTGVGMGSFDLVVASDVPRTGETALAMGFAVDEVHPHLAAHDPSLHDEVERLTDGTRLLSFSQWAEVVAGGDALRAHGIVQSGLWLDCVSRVPEGGACLVISHGGTIEPGVIVSVDRSVWQNYKPLGHCDGVRLAVSDATFVSAEVRRAPVGD